MTAYQLPDNGGRRVGKEISEMLKHNGFIIKMSAKVFPFG